MQIGLTVATPKAAFVNCRLTGSRLQTCREPSMLALPSPAEYKQACNFMGPLRIPIADPEISLTVCLVGCCERRVDYVSQC